VADLPPLELVASEVIETFDIKAPPVPIESMLQHPEPGMWEEVDIARLSIGFLSIKDAYSPRMSLTRLLARHIINSQWGQARKMQDVVKSDADIHAFARMLIMPMAMVRALSSSARNPTTMSFHFEVPEDDARLRLIELSAYLE
jgi:hypothetical protein